jgi:hypothetical protein
VLALRLPVVDEIAVTAVSNVLYASTILLRCPNFARAMSASAFKNGSFEVGKNLFMFAILF